MALKLFKSQRTREELDIKDDINVKEDIEKVRGILFKGETVLMVKQRDARGNIKWIMPGGKFKTERYKRLAVTTFIDKCIKSGLTDAIKSDMRKEICKEKIKQKTSLDVNVEELIFSAGKLFAYIVTDSSGKDPSINFQDKNNKDVIEVGWIHKDTIEHDFTRGYVNKAYEYLQNK